MFEEISSFNFPTAVRFGCNAVQQLGACLSQAGSKRPLLVTDAGIAATDVYPKVIAALDAAGVQYAAYTGVHSNPLAEDVAGAVAVYREHGCDGLIGLGGGSPMDVAKIVAVVVKHGEPLARYEAQAGGYELITGPLPPIITIPTTAGTGSEVGRSGVVTIPELGRKVVIFSPLLMPRFAILDPNLTVGLPPHLTAATGMDALTHCIESLTAPVFQPLCDHIALGGIELVTKYLLRATTDGSDIEARGYMMIAAMEGAIAFQKDLGATHSLAHPLSTECNLHHGLANAVCLPAVMRFNIPVAAEAYKRVATIFGMNTFNVPAEEAAALAVDAVVKLMADLRLPSALRDCGVPESLLPVLSQKAFEDSCHKTNPRECTQADLLKLYKESW